MTTDIKLNTSLCPICHFTLSSPFFDGEAGPLATLGWPKSKSEAQQMARMPLDYVQCPRCSHVWNKSFSYEAIPYQNNPNRMFNHGSIWQGHLATTRDLLTANLPKAPTIIDIGCGEGHFIRGLSTEFFGNGRFIGFDPNTTTESGLGVEFYPRYFEPLKDIADFNPNLIIMRHVLEHLTDPAAFIEKLAWATAQNKIKILFFAEMPCIDRVIETSRLVDFFYEHPSQFTTQSFQTLMERGGRIIELSHGYNHEVIYALVDLGFKNEYLKNAEASYSFLKSTGKCKNTITDELRKLACSGKSIVIWGGTGKSAAFINYYGATADLFPLVVDSDPDKVGTFVPGTGQKIQFRDILKGKYIDIVIIPTQWRAKDIASEIEREKIKIGEVMIEHNGRLISFFHDEHPYR